MESDEDSDGTIRERLTQNELQSFANRGFHDGYDEGTSLTFALAMDDGYKEGFEQQFALSTLKGIATALLNLCPRIQTVIETIDKLQRELAEKQNPPPLPQNNSRSSPEAVDTAPSSSSPPPPSKDEKQTCLIVKDTLETIRLIKMDLMNVCKENKMEILAHFVSEIA